MKECGDPMPESASNSGGCLRLEGVEVRRLGGFRNYLKVLNRLFVILTKIGLHMPHLSKNSFIYERLQAKDLYTLS